MNRILTIILVAFSFAGFGQTINQLEYFVDNDPGYGNGEEISFETGSSVTATFNFDNDDLAEGMHNLCVRACNVNGKWSSVSRAAFYKFPDYSSTQITRIEYFIDNDPGFGNATPVAISPADEVPAFFNISTAGLSSGCHFLSVRVKDINSRWSVLSCEMFYYQDLTEINLTKLEYFVDTDPGFGMAINIPVSTGENVNSVFSFATTGLTEGLHFICVRAKDAQGRWSSLQKGIFYKEPQTKFRITSLEYAYDSMPAFGHAIPVMIDTSYNVVTGFATDTTTLTIGNHNLLVRVKDEAGNWSILQKTAFMWGHLLRTWTGIVNDDWNVAGNWNPSGVPGYNDNVLIPTGPTVMPVLRTSGLSCNKVFVEQGAGLHINPGVVLSITGK